MAKCEFTWVFCKKTKFGVPKVKSLPGTVISFSFCCDNIHCHALKLMDDRFSAVAESQLLSFFVHRPWPKTCFSHFLHFGRGGNAVFTVFHPSAMAESHFSAFLVRRPRPKRRICLFLIFRRG